MTAVSKTFQNVVSSREVMIQVGNTLFRNNPSKVRTKRESEIVYRNMTRGLELQQKDPENDFLKFRKLDPHAFMSLDN